MPGKFSCGPLNVMLLGALKTKLAASINFYVRLIIYTLKAHEGQAGILRYNETMGFEPDWMERFDHELSQAEAAREKGNEGKARVCARRAAGIAAGEYFRRKSVEQVGASAYDRLKQLQELPGISEEIRKVVSNFLQRVDVDHNLPGEADLIAEARFLAEQLLSK